MTMRRHSIRLPSGGSYNLARVGLLSAGIVAAGNGDWVETQLVTSGTRYYAILDHTSGAQLCIGVSSAGNLTHANNSYGGAAITASNLAIAWKPEVGASATQSWAAINPGVVDPLLTATWCSDADSFVFQHAQKTGVAWTGELDYLICSDVDVAGINMVSWVPSGAFYAIINAWDDAFDDLQSGDTETSVLSVLKDTMSRFNGYAAGANCRMQARDSGGVLREDWLPKTSADGLQSELFDLGSVDVESVQIVRTGTEGPKGSLKTAVLCERRNNNAVVDPRDAGPFSDSLIGLTKGNCTGYGPRV